MRHEKYYKLLVEYDILRILVYDFLHPLVFLRIRIQKLYYPLYSFSFLNSSSNLAYIFLNATDSAADLATDSFSLVGFSSHFLAASIASRGILLFKIILINLMVRVFLLIKILTNFLKLQIQMYPHQQPQPKQLIL
jgi:hypothetical protein